MSAAPNKRRVLLAGTFATATLLHGAAWAQPQKALVYRCDDGTQLTAAFRFRSAQLQLDGRTVVLTRRIAASGSRYSKRRLSFRIKGRDATLTRGPRSTTCRVG
jgi:membrane-bound inhibitor of C-type lysozyme